jgi:mono/diheme cytochrome c family protein
MLVITGLILMTGCASQSEVSNLRSTLDPELAKGQQIFVTHCGACHSTIPDVVIVGPSMAGIATHGHSRVDGLDARTYVFSSILQPSDYIVPGYQDLMPKDLAKKLTGEELDSIVAYVLSLD